MQLITEGCAAFNSDDPILKSRADLGKDSVL